MTDNMDNTNRSMHTNEELYHRQMDMLRVFLSHGTITQEQFDKSAGDLTRLMGYGEKRTEEE